MKNMTLALALGAIILAAIPAHADPFKKGVENIYKKYKQPFTLLDANVERLCAEEIEQGLNDHVGDIHNGKRITRETNAERNKKDRAMFQARDLQELSDNHSTLSRRSLSPDFVCITKALILQKMPISKHDEDEFGTLLHGWSRSQSTPFSIAGAYYRTGNNSWAVISDDDQQKVYREITELRERLFERRSSSASGNLSPQQISACSEEIKNKQIESQSWGGDVNDVSARLGQFQKKLFEGRCAKHPEAQAYIAGANKMLGYGGSATGSASGRNGGGNAQSNDRATTAGDNPTSSSSADSRSSTKKKKRQHVPDAVASKCLSLNNDKPGFGGFVNSCNYAVFYTYCAEHPKKGAWTEAFDCDNRHGLGSDVVGANKTSGSHTKGAKQIHWVACKYKEPDGTYAGISVTGVKWDAQKRMLNFRCSE